MTLVDGIATTLPRSTRLERLTPAEVTRLGNLYEYYPLTVKDIDVSLSRKGWVVWYDADALTGAVVPAETAYRYDNHAPVLYDESGRVAPIWKRQ